MRASARRTRKLAAGLCSLLLLVACDQGGAPAVGTLPAPPPGAKFLDPGITPESVLAEVMSVRGVDNQREIADGFKDKWIPSPGWEGTIEKLANERGKTFMWFHRPAPTLIGGGSFLVAAELPVNDRDVQMRQVVTFTGRIDDVQVIMAGPIPEFRIIVRDARVLTVDGK